MKNKESTNIKLISKFSTGSSCRYAEYENGISNGKHEIKTS